MKIAVIGSGTMGLGIAQAFAMNADMQVTICLEKGKDPEFELARFYEPLERLLKREKISSELLQDVKQRVQAGDIYLAADADLVIESVFEKEEIKKAVLKELDTICKPETVITSNTSSLSIIELETVMQRPLIGLHFFNPAAVMKLVEIIPGQRANKELVNRIGEIAGQIGKCPVEVKDSPGFVVNRILIPMINEAAGIYAAGIASAQGIDDAMKFGANQPMGPLALGDLIGLDICVAILEVIYQGTKDEKYKPHLLLVEMVEQGMLGKKTGRGFYEYS